MKRVVLLVTGKTEEALGASLKLIFPNVEFIVPPKRDGFTSYPLPANPILKRRGQQNNETHIQKLVNLLIAEVEPGRRRDEPIPDMVLLVDDLELCNVAWPERAIEHVRAAVRACVEDFSWTSDASRTRAVERLRERCSFHLLCPMVEAYFFADSAALERAGAKRASAFDATAVDVEQFVVQDLDFTIPKNHKHKNSLPKWATSGREKHPKNYLQFLCDPSGASPRPYLEVDDEQGRPSGQAALRKLDWSSVFAPAPSVQFIRSLIHDLADALDEPGVKQQFHGATHPLTWPPTRGNVLRNV